MEIHEFRNIQPLPTISDKGKQQPHNYKNIIKDTLFALLKRADKRVDIPFRWLDSNLNSFELTKINQTKN